FWMVARQREADLMHSEGLGALADFRARGGSLAILPGNHDLWICPFYERTLGAPSSPSRTTPRSTASACTWFTATCWAHAENGRAGWRAASSRTPSSCCPDPWPV